MHTTIVFWFWISSVCSGNGSEWVSSLAWSAGGAAEGASRMDRTINFKHVNHGKFQVSESHELSNMRHLALEKHPCESREEVLLREKLEDLKNWQQQFWVEHNLQYQSVQFLRRFLTTGKI